VAKDWRRETATAAQRRKLFAMGRNGNLPRTKGEASDLIKGGSNNGGCIISVLAVIILAIALLASRS
jgi:amino acid transporter